MFRLTLANLLRRPARTLLTVAAIALSVALVVSTTSGYASTELAIRGFIDDFFGSDDLRVDQRSDAGGIPESYIDELVQEPDVASAYGRLSVSRQLSGPDGKLIATKFDVLGVDPQADGYLSRLPLDSGRVFDSQDAREVVLDIHSQRSLGLAIGDTLTLPGPGGDTDLEDRRRHLQAGGPEHHGGSDDLRPAADAAGADPSRRPGAASLQCWRNWSRAVTFRRSSRGCPTASRKRRRAGACSA